MIRIKFCHGFCVSFLSLRVRAGVVELLSWSFLIDRLLLRTSLIELPLISESLAPPYTQDGIPTYILLDKGFHFTCKPMLCPFKTKIHSKALHRASWIFFYPIAMRNQYYSQQTKTCFSFSFSVWETVRKEKWMGIRLWSVHWWTQREANSSILCDTGRFNLEVCSPLLFSPIGEFLVWLIKSY